MNSLSTLLPGHLIRYIIYSFYEASGIIPESKFKLPSHTLTGLPILDALLLGEIDVFYSVLSKFIWPALTLGLVYGAIFARYIRNNLLDFLESDFVLFLRAKGIPDKDILKPALKHSSIVLLNVIGFIFSTLLGGVVVIEVIFRIPGVGLLLYNALTLYDIVIILGTIFFPCCNCSISKLNNRHYLRNNRSKNQILKT